MCGCDPSRGIVCSYHAGSCDRCGCDLDPATAAYHEDQYFEKENAVKIETELLIENVPLTALDRCDGCGAQALHRASLPGGGELLFCGHHFRASEANLVLAGATFSA